MFSQESRCIYQLNQLGEVICQLRFPEILAISANAPVAFQEAVRHDFPQYSSRKEVPPGQFPPQKITPVINHQFVSADGLWRINLTQNFISLSCRSYTRWEDFAARLDKPLANFIQIYKPAYFERVGLRYLNFISRNALGLADIPFSQLIAPCYLGPLGEEDVQETATTRCSVDTEINLRSGCRVKIHAGPGMVKRGGKDDGEVKYIFDQDLYMPGNLPINRSAEALETLHSQAYSIFRGAITDTLHDAMEPEFI